MIKIYGIAGSRALRSLWAAEECGIAYEHHPVHFVGDSKKPEYLAINPNGRVPALVDGELVLFESMAINLYLARRYGGALWPAAEADQARTLQWSFWGITEIEPHMIPVVVHSALLPEEQRDPAVVEEHAKALERPLPILDAHLSGRDYVLGADAFSIADLNLAGSLFFASLAGFDLSPWPEVKRWLSACEARPALKRARNK